MVPAEAAAVVVVAAVAEHELRSGLKHEVGDALDKGTAVVLALVYPDGQTQVEKTLHRAHSIKEVELDRTTVKSLDDAVAAEIAKLPHADTPDTSS